MPKIKLDSAFCATASCLPDKDRTDYYDTSITGFILETRASGGKTFYLRYFTEQGKQRQLKIGGYGDITFDQARKKAKELRANVVLKGDPAAEKAERKGIPNYDELADQHHAYAKTYQKTPANTEAILRIHLRPKWGKMRLNEITQQKVAAWLADKHDEGMAPATVEKLRVMLNRSFELAAKWGLPGSVPNPVKHIPRRKFNNARQRYLSADEARRLHKAVAGSRNCQLRHIVGLLLLTGARRNEILQARWEHVDLERRALFIPDTKTGVPRHVPLSQPALDLIGKLRKFDKCPWLLPNPKTRAPYTCIKRAWDTARDEAGLPGLRLHDLRHSAASFMINAGIDLYAVGRILGHADHQSTQRYSHLANDTLLAAVEAGAAKMQGSWGGMTDGV
ncbi:MAG TPA: site-specific integrase [Novosphingobium sp.]|nr:site-specific integrase [Novosphingobium sp.]